MSFNGIFFSGERGDDLGQIKIVEIARFTEDDSFLFIYLCDNTLRYSILFSPPRLLYSIGANPMICIKHF